MCCPDGSCAIRSGLCGGEEAIRLTIFVAPVMFVGLLHTVHVLDCKQSCQALLLILVLVLYKLITCTHGYM